ncbi:hypothetical protein C8255_19765 [filamentous cyanobacterium CCP3]|nr:hypothetical protein C8255_19765 [filamentous cyanobacterium CCP3]
MTEINKEDRPRPPIFELDEESDKRAFEDYAKEELGATEAEYKGVDVWQDAVIETDVGTFHMGQNDDGTPYVEKKR